MSRYCAVKEPRNCAFGLVKDCVTLVVNFLCRLFSIFEKIQCLAANKKSVLLFLIEK